MKMPRIYPPVWLLLCLGAMILLHYQAPVLRWLSEPWRYLGGILLLTGFVLTGHAAFAFKKAATDLIPFKQVTTLVTDGFYRFTRNPMYLGMLLELAGVWVILGTLSPVLVLGFFVWIIQRQYILPEEAMLEGLFGDEYQGFKQRVRRWL